MRKILLLLSLIGSYASMFSQNLMVDQTTYTVEELITDVLIDSPCANVSNITFSTGTNFGSSNGIGFFEEPTGLFPFAEGIVLAAGDANMCEGPNTGLADLSTGGTGWPGDPELLALIQPYDPLANITYNASIIEFDFVPLASEVTVRFAMASEEYGTPSFECDFSDIFAFLLTDQGGTTTNLAVLPDTNIPILVTTVHPDNGAPCGAANPQYFSQYTAIGGPPIRQNGYTRSFTALAQVNPGESYHIKLAIADARDALFDSAVFLEAGSFSLDLDLGDDMLVASGNAECDGDTVTLNTGSPTADHIWYVDGVEIVGETGSTLDVTVPGEYSVDVEFSAGCQTSDTIIIEFVTNPVANPALDLFECSAGPTAEFDLTENDLDILGAQNPADYAVSYFESQADADAANNPLTSPYTNLSSPQTIYARIESTNNGDCYDTTTFEIEVGDVVFNDPISDLILCDDNSNDGIASFLLTDRDTEVATSAGYAVTDVTISYHETQADADAAINPLASPYNNTSNPQTIYALLIDNGNPLCFETIELNLAVNPLPEVLNITLEQCDEDGVPDGLTEYNLTEIETDILVSGDTSGLTLSYHLSQADADANVNAQNPSPFNNTANPQIIYVRVEDDITGCYNVAEVTLDVTATDVGDVTLEACDDDYDGFTEFTLSDADAIILATLPPGLTVAYYETANDAQLEINQLPNNYTNVIASLQTIFIRVEDANNCYGIATMDLIVNPLPQNNSVANTEFCSDDPDSASIDLTTFDAEVLGGQLAADFTISYYDSQADADADINALISPYTNTSNPQIIYVRIENNVTGCFITSINFELSVNPNPTLLTPTPLEVCDDAVIDGFTSIDLNLKNDEISGGDPNYAVTYYL
ncbi:MAG: choice-of-anchor L domain-containing protein, partial [Bacteroidia bacterium]|nr:choice-of-anchor L domain-containing protein [Bacteroidia bacterium]